MTGFVIIWYHCCVSLNTVEILYHLFTLMSPQFSIMHTRNFRLNTVPDKKSRWEIWGKMHYWKGRQSFSWNQQKGLDGSNASRKLSTDIWRPSREKNRFREMMGTLIRDRCPINCTINASPWGRASYEKEASCNIMLERTAVGGMGTLRVPGTGKWGSFP